MEKVSTPWKSFYFKPIPHLHALNIQFYWKIQKQRASCPDGSGGIVLEDYMELSNDSVNSLISPVL